METMTTLKSGNNASTSTSMRLWISLLLRQLAAYLIHMADYIDIEEQTFLSEKIQITSVQAEDKEEIMEKEIDFELESVSGSKTLGRERKDSTDSGFDREDLEIPEMVTGRDEETGLDLISLEEVGCHAVREDAWLVVYDKVYEMTEYLEQGRHPGGEEVILEYLGWDATLAFRGAGHSAAALRGLEKYCIGILPRDERLNFSPE